MRDNESNGVWVRGGKRMADFAAAALLIVLLLPLALLTAVAIKLSSPGPVLFRQTRGGRFGKPFVLRKFRTMKADRTPDPKELVPLSHPDITPLGRFLRHTKIDEMPQLLNVLAGQMSLVGPRPTLLNQVEAYDSFRRKRLLARPGITGLAQIHGNTTISWDQRILFDIAYVRRCGFLLDCWILLRTIAVITTGDPPHPTPFQQTRFASYVSIPPDYDRTTPN